MKKKNKTGIIICSIIVSIIIIIIGLIGYFVAKDLKQEELLKQEIVNVSNKDLLNDDFKVNVVTTGDYAYVEESIKKYYLELSNNIKTLNKIFSDEKLQNVLSVENIERDKPNFTNSYAVLDTAKDKTQKTLNNIIELCNEETILNLLDKEKVSNYYIDFYKNLMYTEQDKKEFEKTKTDMQTLSNNISNFLDKAREMITLLQQNNSSWQISNGNLYFNSTTLVDQYNKLYGELNQMAEENFDTSTNNQSNKSNNNNI